ncbi:MAG: glycosyltransferase family 2 protein [Pseudomonadota bacterium]
MSAVTIGEHKMIGAVQAETTTEVACPVGMLPVDAQRIFDGRLQKLVRTGHSLFATLSAGSEGDHPELELLRDRNVMVAIRNGETPEAARDWLTYHVQHQGAEAALIVDRDPPETGDFSHSVGELISDIPVVVVSFGVPLGLPATPDARHPALAPGARKQAEPPIDPWHAPLREVAILELLRHRFLASASAVALLDIADMVLPSDAGNLFDLAHQIAGQAVLLRGIETYPWRLRQGAAARHGDHIAKRRGERRRLSSWALARTELPNGAAFRFGRQPRGVPLRNDAVFSFARSMGVVFPSVPVNALVQKNTLVESQQLVEFVSEKLEANPIRLPAPDVIASRPETNTVTVVTAMKNEGPFILDWIAHNRAIGVTSHLVYTNDCEDGTDQLLDALSDAGVVRRDNPFRKTGKVPQYAAFKAAEDEDVVAQADWLLTLDMDAGIAEQTPRH